MQTKFRSFGGYLSAVIGLIGAMLIPFGYLTFGLMLADFNPEVTHLPLAIIWSISVILSLISPYLLSNLGHRINILRTVRTLSGIALLIVLGINIGYVSLDGATTNLTWIT